MDPLAVPRLTVPDVVALRLGRDAALNAGASGYRFTVGHGETDNLEWTLESVHFPDPVTRWSAALYTTTQTAVIEQLMAELGILLDGVAFRELDGRIYTALVPFGGAARKPQPRWLLPIISRTSPALRQRLAAAHAADVSDWSGAVVEEWHERAEDELLERARAYLVGDLSALNEEQVAGRLDEQLRLVEEGLTWHFRLHAAGVDAIGRLGLELTRDHGWRVADVMDLFTGLSATTTGPAAAQEELAALGAGRGRGGGAAGRDDAGRRRAALPDHRRRPRAVPGRVGTARRALRDRLPDGRRAPGLAAAPAPGGRARARGPGRPRCRARGRPVAGRGAPDRHVGQQLR